MKADLAFNEEEKVVFIKILNSRVIEEDVNQLATFFDEQCKEGYQKYIIDVSQVVVAVQKFTILLEVVKSQFSLPGKTLLVVSSAVLDNPAEITKSNLYRLFRGCMYSSKDEAFAAIKGGRGAEAGSAPFTPSAIVEEDDANDGIIILSLASEVVSATAGDIEVIMREALDKRESVQGIVFTFHPSCKSVDASGLSLFVRVKREVARKGGRVFLAGAISLTEKEKICLLSIFPGEWFPTLQEAIEALRIGI